MCSRYIYETFAKIEKLKGNQDGSVFLGMVPPLLIVTRPFYDNSGKKATSTELHIKNKWDRHIKPSLLTSSPGENRSTGMTDHHLPRRLL